MLFICFLEYPVTTTAHLYNIHPPINQSVTFTTFFSSSGATTVTSLCDNLSLNPAIYQSILSTSCSMFISPSGIIAVYHNNNNRIAFNKFHYSSQTCHYIVNTIPTFTQIRTGIRGEMSRQLQSGGPLERRSTISVSCRPSTLFSGKIFKEPQLQFTTPAQ